MATGKNLVLGGSGTIGKALCQYLADRGEQVINLDIKDGFDLRKDDLQAYTDVDFVWFLAWEVGGAKFLSKKNNQLKIIKDNTQICDKVFDFLEKSKLPFLFTSSQLAATDNPYGLTKLLGEEWTNLLGGQIVRFWNVYGWEEPSEKSHVIPDLVLQGLSDKRIQLMTTGEEERQFIFIDDCVKNLVKIRDKGWANVDLTNGEWIKIKDLAKMIGYQLDVPVNLGDQKGYNNKLDPSSQYDLDWNINLEKGIEKIIAQANKFKEKENLHGSYYSAKKV